MADPGGNGWKSGIIPSARLGKAGKFRKGTTQKAPNGISGGTEIGDKRR